jgi:hypothetical protein
MWAIVRDVTATRALQAQLVQSQKLESIGRLAGGVAHDFNNMLGVILGHAELALAQDGAAQPLRDDLQEIQKAARRSADLTKHCSPLHGSRRSPRSRWTSTPPWRAPSRCSTGCWAKTSSSAGNRPTSPCRS